MMKPASLARKFVEIEVVAETTPVALVARSVFARLVMAKVVVVAFVVVEFTMERLVMVDEAALTRMPPVKDRRVEVASPGNG